MDFKNLKLFLLNYFIGLKILNKILLNINMYSQFGGAAAVTNPAPTPAPTPQPKPAPAPAPSPAPVNPSSQTVSSRSVTTKPSTPVKVGKSVNDYIASLDISKFEDLMNGNESEVSDRVKSLTRLLKEEENNIKTSGKNIDAIIVEIEQNLQKQKKLGDSDKLFAQLVPQGDLKTRDVSSIDNMSEFEEFMHKEFRIFDDKDAEQRFIEEFSKLKGNPVKNEKLLLDKKDDFLKLQKEYIKLLQAVLNRYNLHEFTFLPEVGKSAKGGIFPQVPPPGGGGGNTFDSWRHPVVPPNKSSTAIVLPKVNSGQWANVSDLNETEWLHPFYFADDSGQVHFKTLLQGSKVSENNNVPRMGRLFPIKMDDFKYLLDELDRDKKEDHNALVPEFKAEFMTNEERIKLFGIDTTIQPTSNSSLPLRVKSITAYNKFTSAIRTEEGRSNPYKSLGIEEKIKKFLDVVNSNKGWSGYWYKKKMEDAYTNPDEPVDPTVTSWNSISELQGGIPQNSKDPKLKNVATLKMWMWALQCSNANSTNAEDFADVLGANYVPRARGVGTQFEYEAGILGGYTECSFQPNFPPGGAATENERSPRVDPLTTVSYTEAEKLGQIGCRTFVHRSYHKSAVVVAGGTGAIANGANIALNTSPALGVGRGVPPAAPPPKNVCNPWSTRLICCNNVDKFIKDILGGAWTEKPDNKNKEVTLSISSEKLIENLKKWEDVSQWWEYVEAQDIDHKGWPLFVLASAVCHGTQSIDTATLETAEKQLDIARANIYNKVKANVDATSVAVGVQGCDPGMAQNIHWGYTSAGAGGGGGAAPLGYINPSASKIVPYLSSLEGLGGDSKTGYNINGQLDRTAGGGRLAAGGGANSRDDGPYHLTGGNWGAFTANDLPVWKPLDKMGVNRAVMLADCGEQGGNAVDQSAVPVGDTKRPMNPHYVDVGTHWSNNEGIYNELAAIHPEELKIWNALQELLPHIYKCAILLQSENIDQIDRYSEEIRKLQSGETVEKGKKIATKLTGGTENSDVDEYPGEIYSPLLKEMYGGAHWEPGKIKYCCRSEGQVHQEGKYIGVTEHHVRLRSLFSDFPRFSLRDACKFDLRGDVLPVNNFWNFVRDNNLLQLFGGAPPALGPVHDIQGWLNIMGRNNEWKRPNHLINNVLFDGGGFIDSVNGDIQHAAQADYDYIKNPIQINVNPEGGNTLTQNITGDSDVSAVVHYFFNVQAAYAPAYKGRLPSIESSNPYNPPRLNPPKKGQTEILDILNDDAPQLMYGCYKVTDELRPLIVDVDKTKPSCLCHNPVSFNDFAAGINWTQKYGQAWGAVQLAPAPPALPAGRNPIVPTTNFNFKVIYGKQNQKRHCNEDRGGKEFCKPMPLKHLRLKKKAIESSIPYFERKRLFEIAKEKFKPFVERGLYDKKTEIIQGEEKTQEQEKEKSQTQEKAQLEAQEKTKEQAKEQAKAQEEAGATAQEKLQSEDGSVTGKEGESDFSEDGSLGLTGKDIKQSQERIQRLEGEKKRIELVVRRIVETEKKHADVNRFLQLNSRGITADKQKRLMELSSALEIKLKTEIQGKKKLESLLSAQNEEILLAKQDHDDKLKLQEEIKILKTQLKMKEISSKNKAESLTLRQKSLRETREKYQKKEYLKENESRKYKRDSPKYLPIYKEDKQSRTKKKEPARKKKEPARKKKDERSKRKNDRKKKDRSKRKAK